MTPEFWKGRRVLVTGHTGFKGAWAVEWLLALGAEVTGFSLEPETSPNLTTLLDHAGRMDSRIGDVNDRAAVDAVLADTKPEIILHMAAQALVRRSYRDPAESFMTNVIGVVNLLHAASMVDSVKAVVIVTSDKCYDNVEQIWGYREGDPMGGRDPYSASKGCAELATASMRMSYFQPYRADGHPAQVASVRAGNVIGGGDWSEDRLIPDIVKGCLGPAGEVEIRSPNSVRPWQHVLEPVRGYMMLAEKLATGAGFDTGWNFGPERVDERPVIDVAEALVGALGAGRLDVPGNPETLHEAKLLRLDSTKARIDLGWIPAINFDDTIRFTADWYGGWHAGTDPVTLTQAQISEYSALAGGDA